MKIYSYTNTGEYIYSQDASLDPLELELNGKEIYLLPAFATFEVPPEPQEGKLILWTGKWELIDIPKPIIQEEPIVPPLSKEEQDAIDLEVLIQDKIRQQAIEALKAEGKI